MAEEGNASEGKVAGQDVEVKQETQAIAADIAKESVTGKQEIHTANGGGQTNSNNGNEGGIQSDAENKEVICPYCKELYSDPCTLPCNHVLCRKKCAGKIIRYKKYLKCPVCEANHCLAESELGLPPDLVRAKKVADLKGEPFRPTFPIVKKPDETFLTPEPDVAPVSLIAPPQPRPRGPDGRPLGPRPLMSGAPRGRGVHPPPPHGPYRFPAPRARPPPPDDYDYGHPLPHDYYDYDYYNYDHPPRPEYYDEYDDPPRSPPPRDHYDDYYRHHPDYDPYNYPPRRPVARGDPHYDDPPVRRLPPPYAAYDAPPHPRSRLPPPRPGALPLSHRPPARPPHSAADEYLEPPVGAPRPRPPHPRPPHPRPPHLRPHHPGVRPSLRPGAPRPLGPPRHVPSVDEHEHSPPPCPAPRLHPRFPGARPPPPHAGPHGPHPIRFHPPRGPHGQPPRPNGPPSFQPGGPSPRGPLPRGPPSRPGGPPRGPPHGPRGPPPRGPPPGPRGPPPRRPPGPGGPFQRGPPPMGPHSHGPVPTDPGPDNPQFPSSTSAASNYNPTTSVETSEGSSTLFPGLVAIATGRAAPPTTTVATTIEQGPYNPGVDPESWTTNYWQMYSAYYAAQSQAYQDAYRSAYENYYSAFSQQQQQYSTSYPSFNPATTGLNTGLNTMAPSYSTANTLPGTITLSKGPELYNQVPTADFAQPPPTAVTSSPVTIAAAPVLAASAAATAPTWSLQTSSAFDASDKDADEEMKGFQRKPRQKIALTLSVKRAGAKIAKNLNKLEDRIAAEVEQDALKNKKDDIKANFMQSFVSAKEPEVEKKNEVEIVIPSFVAPLPSEPPPLPPVPPPSEAPPPPPPPSDVPTLPPGGLRPVGKHIKSAPIIVESSAPAKPVRSILKRRPPEGAGAATPAPPVKQTKPDDGRASRYLLINGLPAGTKAADFNMFLNHFAQVESCKIGTNKSVSGSAVFAVVTLENVIESHKLIRILEDEPFRGTILSVKKLKNDPTAKSSSSR